MLACSYAVISYTQLSGNVAQLTKITAQALYERVIPAITSVQTTLCLAVTTLCFVVTTRCSSFNAQSLAWPAHTGCKLQSVSAAAQALYERVTPATASVQTLYERVIPANASLHTAYCSSTTPASCKSTGCIKLSPTGHLVPIKAIKASISACAEGDLIW